MNSIINNTKIFIKNIKFKNLLQPSGLRAIFTLLGLTGIVTPAVIVQWAGPAMAVLIQAYEALKNEEKETLHV